MRAEAKSKGHRLSALRPAKLEKLMSFGRFRSSNLRTAFLGFLQHLQAYQEVVDVFREELHRRGMVPPKQLHTDWFPGFPAIARASLPGCRLRQGIEHARRAIRRNHNSGTAQARGAPRRRSRAARGRGHGGGRRGRGVAAEQPLPIEQGPERAIPPHLTSRPIGVFLCFVSESMFLPTMLSFHLFWKVTRRRMTEHWPDPQFANYFFQRYIKEERFQEQPLYTASWHCGVAGRSLPGLPASQQTAEQAWRCLKRHLAPQEVRTHMDLIQALRRTVRIWSQPLTDELAKCDKGVRTGAQNLVSAASG